ncbi:hypothetical protein LXA43DRAFT_1099620 [Ganoderma leucocontextum]|nr:hypothetical protein LXA43DRAFT_1099620 [Ganoderma leucocontextum]
MLSTATQMQDHQDSSVGYAALEIECRTLRLNNLCLQQRLSHVETTLGVREKELAQCEAELFIYRSQASGEASIPRTFRSRTSSGDSSMDDVEITMGPNVTHNLPTSSIFVRPNPTDDELLTSSLWAQSGHPDPSVELHPPSAWYRWFQSTVPSSGDTLILAPPEPQHPANIVPPIPYSLPSYVFTLLGPEALRKDESLAEAACLRIKTGRKIKPPPPRPGLFGDLGRWEGVEIITVLQAHNIRHCATSDQDLYAARAYRQLHTVYTDRTKPRSEGVQYLMKAFSADVSLFP